MIDIAENFQKIRIEESERRETRKQPKLTQKRLSSEFLSLGFAISEEQIKKIESNSPGVAITRDILIAYNEKFGVSADWLLGINHTEYTKGSYVDISNLLGISESNIEKIIHYSKEEKVVINGLIKNSSLKQIMQAIVNFFPCTIEVEQQNISNEFGIDYHRFMALEKMSEALNIIRYDKTMFNYFMNKFKKEHSEKFITISCDQYKKQHPELSEPDFESYRLNLIKKFRTSYHDKLPTKSKAKSTHDNL